MRKRENTVPGAARSGPKNKKKAAGNIIDIMAGAKAVLAPMSGITDVPFRIMARKFGCKVAFTEMIDVNGIVYKNRKTLRMLDRCEETGPLGVQIVGSEEDRILHAAKVCEEKGFDVLDLNAGCPAPKVVKGGKGAALLKDPVKLARIVRLLRDALSVPVTVKIRSGWDDESLNYLEVAKAVSSEGASAICIHSRTKNQMYKGKANWDIIGEVKRSVDIPVFASGNIFSAHDVKDVIASTGCDGVFVARGALGHPWIFTEINELFSGDISAGSTSFDDIKDVILEHYSCSASFYGEERTFKKMYKHLSWYLKRFKNLNEIMKVYLKIKDMNEFRAFIGRLCLDERNWLYLVRSM